MKTAIRLVLVAMFGMASTAFADQSGYGTAPSESSDQAGSSTSSSSMSSDDQKSQERHTRDTQGTGTMSSDARASAGDEQGGGSGEPALRGQDYQEQRFIQDTWNMP